MSATRAKIFSVGSYRTTALTGRTFVPDVRLELGALPAAAVVALAEDGLGVVCVREGRGEGTWAPLGWVTLPGR